MKQTQRGQAARFIWLGLIIVTTLVIWGFSLTPAEQSSEQSGFVKKILMWLLGEGALAEFFFTYIPVRKLAHFTEYFVLGAEWSGYSHVSGRRWIWLCGLPVAVMDELLQFLSPGRAPGVTDVLIDTAGFLCGLCVLWLIFHGLSRRKT